LGAWARLWVAATPSYKVPGTQTKVTFRTSNWATRGLRDWRPDWKAHIIGSVLRLRPGTFLDIGANIGQTLMDWHSQTPGGAYIGFEPNSVCVSHLQTVIEENGIPNCRVIPVGLSDANNVELLYLFSGEADPGATTLRGLRPEDEARSIAIPLYRLDDVRHLLGPTPVSFIKIDVEGGELRTLAGMAQLIGKDQPWILCEVLHRDVHADRESYLKRCSDLMSLIRSYGYDVHRLIQSEDGSRVTGFEATSEFPDRVYRAPSSAQECDYLFVPFGTNPADLPLGRPDR
jgi:FkbM family methyltransferase